MKDTVEFGKKIRSLRLVNDLSLRALEELSGISFSFISSIEKGRFSPSRETVIALADALKGANKNELLLLAGFSPEINDLPDDVEIMALKEFGLFFADLREKSGYRSQRELAEKSGVSHSTINRLEAGTHKTSIETLKGLAPYLKGTNYNELIEKAGYLPYEHVPKQDKPVNRAFLELPEDTTEEEREFLQAQVDLQLEIFRKLKGKNKN